MGFCNCNCRDNCIVAAFVAALVVGIVGAFLQITATIALGTVFLWAILGAAAVYLLALVTASAVTGRSAPGGCCSALSSVLIGILGSILFSVILLLVNIPAAGVVSALLVGLLLFSVTLAVAASACYVRCSTDCAA